MTDETRDPTWIRRSDGTWGPIDTVEEACAAAFRGAWRGLASQGWAPSAEARSTGVPRCLYNGPNGRHCAVGWLLLARPNADNDTAFGWVMVHRLALPLAAWAATATAYDQAAFVSFVERMQKAHDDASVRKSVRGSFDAFRRAHGYPVPVPS